ncbi:MAG: hypothetical protein EXR69_09505 [Myxococcales bacterium]|nr:hypothetical protein [Myxococcales bacterium]
MSTFTGGLVSGIDTASLIASLVAANSTTLVVIQAQREVVSDRKDAYDTLASRLDSLASTIAAIDTTTEFRSVSGSSNNDAVGVTVAGDAVVGHLTVTVEQLASSAMEVSDGVADRDVASTMATGTYAFTVAGVHTTVEIDAGSSSLDNVVSAINDQVDGVTAYVMDTGDPTAPYRLVIAVDSTGAENTLTIDTTGLFLGTGFIPTFTAVTDARDAELTVNGIAITSASNEVTDVIQGVTLSLTDVTTTDATVTISSDVSGMATKLAAVVSAYNSVMSYIRGQKAWNPDEGIEGSFVGESQTNTLIRSLQTLTGNQYTPVGDFANLASLGITTEQDGDLVIDDDVLNAALQDGMEDVTTLFTEADTGIAAMFTALLEGLTGDDGSITGRSEALEDQLEAFDARIATYEEQLAAYEDRLEKQFTAMEIAIAGFNAANSALLALLPSTDDD